MPLNLFIAQGVTTSFIACLYAFIPSVSSAYWIFEVMTTQVYLIVYLLMFPAAAKLRRTRPDRPRGYTAPALRTICVVGFLATALAILLGFYPPSQLKSGNTFVYIGLVLAGVVIVGPGIPFLLYKFRKPSWKTHESSVGKTAFATDSETEG